MRIIREHIRHAGWLALIALVINLGLSFGHVHAVDAQGRHHTVNSWIVSFISSSDGHAVSNPSPSLPDDDQADQFCAICMAASEMASGMAPLLPAVAVEFTVASVDYAITATPDVRPLHRSVFQSRGPPLS